MIEIKGDWIGYYTFDEGYGDWGKDKRIPFRMIIERGIHEFVGRIFESVEHGGIDDTAVIKGRQNGDTIEFIKQYTAEHFLDENFESVSMQSDNPTTVYYTGAYDYSENKFKGEWEIPMLEEDEAGVFHESNSSGQWFIWREV